MRYVSLVLFGVAGCVEDGGTSAGDLPDPPSCEWGEIAIVAALDGDTTEHRADIANYMAGSGSFDLHGGDFDLELDLDTESPEAGVPAGAWGFVDFGAAGGPNVGNCEEQGFVSTVLFDAVEDRWTGTFELADVADAPYCGGEPRRGVVVGCFDR